MIRFIKVIVLLCTLAQYTSSTAQLSYYLDTRTGKIEIISLIMTPLGTDAQYRNYDGMKEYQTIEIIGDPMENATVKAILPSKEKVTMVLRGENVNFIRVTYQNGNSKIFRDAVLYSNIQNNRIAYFAVHYYYDAHTQDIKNKIYYKSWETNTEQELTITEKAKLPIRIGTTRLLCPTKAQLPCKNTPIPKHI